MVAFFAQSLDNTAWWVAQFTKGRALGVVAIVAIALATTCVLRTLLAFWGPFAPAIVLVPEQFAVEARLKLDASLHAPTH